MALKIVFLFALVALAYGLPATESSVKTGLDLQATNQIPADVESYLEKLLSGDGGDARWKLETNNDEEASPVRVKRACRTIKIRTKSGRIVTLRRC